MNSTTRSDDHPILFQPFQVRDLLLRNRIVVAPMHQYAAVDGFVQDWHLMNAGRFGAGGVGLVMVESTKIEQRGSGTIGDLGIWKDEHIPGLARCVDLIHVGGAAAGLQIGHSGQKAGRHRPWDGGGAVESAEPWIDRVAPSAIGDPMPRELSVIEIKENVDAWGAAARRADAAGFDVLEIHGAHGYLIHQFLSPLSNLRTDSYGGSEANRMRFCMEVIESVRKNWPANKPLFLRLSVTDDAGWGVDDSARLARLAMAAGVDVIDCSSGGIGTHPIQSDGYGYQVPLAAHLKRETQIATMAVGLIVHAEQANQILESRSADLIAIGREALYNPNWASDAAQKLGVDPSFELVPPAQGYWLAKRGRRGMVQPSTYGTPDEIISDTGELAQAQ